jgi:hypothetical protein
VRSSTSASLRDRGTPHNLADMATQVLARRHGPLATQEVTWRMVLKAV